MAQSASLQTEIDDRSTEPDAHELLTEIEGIGPKRADALLQRFGTGREVAKRAASNWGAFLDVDGFTEDRARELFHQMHDAGVYDDLRQMYS